MHLFLNLFLIAFIGLSLLYATTNIGTIELLNGNIKIKPEQSIKKIKATKGQSINSGDFIISSKLSTAKIKLIDGSVFVSTSPKVNPNSEA